jgi:hypothetical protein
MASRFFYLFLLYTFAIERVVSSLVFTNPSLSGLTAGAPFNLTWTGAVGTATVTLQNGTASQIKTVNVVACMSILLTHTTHMKYVRCD